MAPEVARVVDHDGCPRVSVNAPIEVGEELSPGLGYRGHDLDKMNCINVVSDRCTGCNAGGGSDERHALGATVNQQGQVPLPLLVDTLGASAQRIVVVDADQTFAVPLDDRYDARRAAAFEQNALVASRAGEWKGIRAGSDEYRDHTRDRRCCRWPLRPLSRAGPAGLAGREDQNECSQHTESGGYEEAAPRTQRREYDEGRRHPPGDRADRVRC